MKSDKTITLLTLFTILAFSVLIISCGGKGGNEKKNALVEDIESFGVDTIVQSPEEAKDFPSLYDILRRYPELFHATEKAEKEFDKWVVDEKSMIDKVIIANGKSEQEYSTKHEPELEAAVGAMDVRNALQIALTDPTYTNVADVWVDNEIIMQEYLQILSSVDENPELESLSQEERNNLKSEVGHARKSWKAYMDKVIEITPAVPDDYRGVYISCFNNIMRQHLADLRNRYCEYVKGNKGEWKASNVIIDE